jgi:hypothetical protein
MKNKLYTIAAISGLCLSANAFAGEAGVAGSLAIRLNAGNVDWAAAAIAIGKTTAYAGATSNKTDAEAFAVGTGGAITLSGADVYLQAVAEETAAGLAIDQANSLNAQTLDIDGGNGTISNTVP